MVKSRSYIATPPGATIREQLNDRGMNQKEFALRMNMSEKHISRLINGDVQLTPGMAFRLEIVLGVPAKFWNNLEANYREKLVKAEAENAMDKDEALARELPYSEMARYGWVPETRNPKEKVMYLRKYFEVVELSLLDNAQITRLACRRLSITEKSDLALLVWAQEAKIKARDIHTAPINISGLEKIIPDIRRMTLQKPVEFCQSLKKTFTEYGIALVFLPHLKGSFLQAASFMNGNKIVIGLTTRGKDADKFWFSLFHEMGHIVLGHTGQSNGTSEEDEKNTDIWAMNNLIPAQSFEEFKMKKSFSPQAVLDYAKKEGIAPGIVVGRLQNEGCIRHNMLNELKEQYTPCREWQI